MQQQIPIQNQQVYFQNYGVLGNQMPNALPLQYQNIPNQYVNQGYIQNPQNIQQIQNPQNSQINNRQQPQFSQIQNQQTNLNRNQKNNSFLYVLSFPYSCSLCRRGPIYRAMYYCNTCKYIICPQCELKEGPFHIHPLYKAQNTHQFDGLNISGVSQFDKFMTGVGNQFESAYNSVVGFFSGNNNNNNNNNNANNNNNINNSQRSKNVEIINRPQWVSLVQIARTYYDLRNITDQQIEEALIKAQGNIDQAVFSLVPK